MTTGNCISRIKKNRKQFKYPICDNCHKDIVTLGRYIYHDGKTFYVHIKYDETTNKCNLIDDY